MVNISLILIASSVLTTLRRSGVLKRQGELFTKALFVRLRCGRCRPRSVRECGKRPETARPGRLHSGPAGASTVGSMNLTEARYLPGDEALLGSGLIGHSQKMTVAASATAEKKTVGQRS